MDDLFPCPFCGGEAKKCGDYKIFCKCGCCVELYNYSGKGDKDHVVNLWNTRAVNLGPIIQVVAKMDGQLSAYTDLCAANYKIKNSNQP
jgi:hypothetical protein